MSVGVQKRSDRVNGHPTALRRGSVQEWPLLYKVLFMRLIDDHGEINFRAFAIDICYWHL